MKHWLFIGFALAATLPQQVLAQKAASSTAAKIAGGEAPETLIRYCSEPISRLQAHADSIYTPLDKAQVPSGILYDRTGQLAGLTGFNATAADTSSFGHFR